MDNYKERCKELEFLIKNIYPTMSDYQKEKVEGIFPELCESEDEKTAKELIRYLKSRVVFSDENDILFIKKWIAWLEKWKDHIADDSKEVEWSEEDRDMLQSIISDCEKYLAILPKQLAWLKSL